MTTLAGAPEGAAQRGTDAPAAGGKIDELPTHSGPCSCCARWRTFGRGSGRRARHPGGNRALALLPRAGPAARGAPRRNRPRLRRRVRFAGARCDRIVAVCWRNSKKAENPNRTTHRENHEPLETRSRSRSSLFLAAGPRPGQGTSIHRSPGIVVTANQIDVDAGKLAIVHTKNKEVSSLRAAHDHDHTAVNKQAGALREELGVTRRTAPPARAEDGAAQNIANLKIPERRGVRQGVCRPRGGVSPGILDASTRS